MSQMWAQPQQQIKQEIQYKLIKLVKFHLRNGDLRGGVVVQTEGATLQDLKAKSLTLISIYIH